jgi:outer membrane protein
LPRRGVTGVAAFRSSRYPLPPMLAAALVLLGLAPQDAAAAPLPAPRRVDLSLDQAIAAALENDLTLKIEEVSGDISLYAVEASWGVFDPLFRAGFEAVDSETEQQSFQPPPLPPLFTIESQRWIFDTGLNVPLMTGGAFDLAVFQTTTDTSFPGFIGVQDQHEIADTIALTFSQPLLRRRGVSYNTSVQRENQLRYRQQLERIRQSRQDLVNSVSDAYWDLVTALRQLAVADETLALGREQLDQNQRRLDAGVGTEVEVLQANTNIAQRIEQKLLREVAVKGAADRLKALMHPGTDVDTWDLELAPATELPEIDPAQVPDWTSALATALQRRSELKQQVFEIEAAEEALVRAASERDPELNFVVTGRSSAVEGGEGQAFESAIGWDFPTYTAGLRFEVPIGNRTARYNERAARAQIRAARLAYDRTESQVVEEIRSAVRNTNYSIEAVHAAESSMELARRQLAAEQARYREGLSTNFQVLEFQQQLAETLYSYTLARANLAKAWTALQRALGVLGDEQP